MPINKLREENDLINLFCTLAEIPSPSMKEEKVIEWLQNYCNENNLDCKLDNYKNVVIRIPATDETKPPILLSSHMDVIGDDSPVVTYLDGDLIRAQGRTLGADDKAGLANALYFATKVAKSDKPHGEIELVFTRDEENGASGIRNVEFEKLNSKYVLVLDSDSLGQLMTSGASYTTVKIKVTSFKGGHSGIDIADKTRENAAKLIADIVTALPQGVYYSENGQVITSCNLGGIQGGNIKVTNIINTTAEASYSIRSSDRQKEQELKNCMIYEIEDFNTKYLDIAKAEITFEEHLPPFEKAQDDYIPILFEAVARKVGVEPEISSFHAGAETHIYANRQNSKGETFLPFLVGLADVNNMHSVEESVDYKSIIKGQELLTAFYDSYIG
ncbi:M20/M25/M40 family metallo-hydrolase [bacterium]|nr:M20/M25/M40 family metallo-hydrolase [bacterium]